MITRINTLSTPLATLDSSCLKFFILEPILTRRASLSPFSVPGLASSIDCLSVAVMLNFRRKKSAESETSAQQAAVAVDTPRQPFRKAIVPVIACGAGLFSDGYINNVSAPTCAVRSVAVPWLPCLACIRQASVVARINAWFFC